MYKIEITNEKNDLIADASFNTMSEVDDWYEKTKANFKSKHNKNVSDITEEVTEQNRLGESVEAINLGNDTIVIIRKINRKKLKTREWDQDKFMSLLSNETAFQIERSLWNGSLETALYLIPKMNEFYSDSEIKEISEKLLLHESKWSDLI